MKMKYLVGVFIAFIAITLASCNNEDKVIENGGSEATARVSFNISIPNGDPVTYAIHDEAEWGVKSLWLYEFDAQGKLLTIPVNIIGNLKGVGPDYSYSKQVDVADKGIRQFLFVANEPVPAGFAVGGTIDQLHEKLAGKTLATTSSDLLNDVASTKVIPMTGRAVQGNKNSLISVIGNTTVSVKLQRIVARIDVKNNTTNLVITGLKLMKTNTKSFLLPKLDANGQATYAVPTTNTKVSNIATFASLPATFGNTVNLPKAFYLYEGNQPTTKENALTVQVEAKLNGVPVLYTIPFWQNGKGVTVKRNHIYYITLGDGKGKTGISSTINDTPWTGINMNKEYAIIGATYTSGIGTYAMEVVDTATGEKANVLKLDKTANTGLSFNFTTQFTNHSSFTVTVVGTPTWITGAAFTGNTLKFNVTANTTGAERSAKVEVTSNVDPNTKYSFFVKQGA